MLEMENASSVAPTTSLCLSVNPTVVGCDSMLIATVGDAVGGRGECFPVMGKATINAPDASSTSTDIVTVQERDFRRFAAIIGGDLCLVDSGEC